MLRWLDFSIRQVTYQLAIEMPGPASCPTDTIHPVPLGGNLYAANRPAVAPKTEEKKNSSSEEQNLKVASSIEQKETSVKADSPAALTPTKKEMKAPLPRQDARKQLDLLATLIGVTESKCQLIATRVSFLRHHHASIQSFRVFSAMQEVIAQLP